MFSFLCKKKAPAPQEAILKIAKSESLLSRKIEYLEKMREEQLAIAKLYGTSDKKRAIKALKKRNRIDKQLETASGSLSNLEVQREAIENTTMSIEELKTMSQGAQALKKGIQDVGGLHDIVDDLSEQAEASNEISDSLKSLIACDLDDEDALIKELEELTEPPPLEDYSLLDPPTLDPKIERELDESLAQLSQWATREVLIST